jgi:hypothetical protein
MRKKYNNEDGEDTPIECSVDAYRPRCLLPVLLVFFLNTGGVSPYWILLNFKLQAVPLYRLKIHRK